MATNRNTKHPIHAHVPSKNAFFQVQPSGLFAQWPFIGLTLLLIGGLLFGVLAYNVSTNGPLLQWDKIAAKSFRADALNIPPSLVEYLLFGFFAGKELIASIGIILAIYFLHKRFWRELSVLLIGLGGGSLLWYALSRYFERPVVPTRMNTPITEFPSFPNGHAFAAVLCYSLLAYFLVPRMPSRFWKGFIIVLAIVFIIFSGISPLLIAQDYLTDIIAGYALGIALAGLIYTLVERFFAASEVRHKGNLLARDRDRGLRTPGLFKRWPVLGLVMVLLGSLSFAALSYNLVAHGPLVQVDTTVYQDLLPQAKAAPPDVSEVMLYGFFVGKQLVQVIVAVLIVYFLYQRLWAELAMLVLSSAAGSLVWNFFLNYFARPRPPHQTGLTIITIPTYPSGHAMSTIILFGLLAYLLIPKMPSSFWKWTVGISTVLLILFIGFTRVFQANHYLTDVLAGYALGIAWAGLVYTVIENIFIKKA
jgi:undecaprenyl-diphosphatase